MHVQLGELAVIQAGAAHRLARELEAERPHQMQRAAAIGRQAHDVAGVGRNLRLKKHDVEHGWCDNALRMATVTPGPQRARSWRRRPQARSHVKFCGLELRLARRAALGLRRLRRGVHAHRGVLQPRCRRHRSQGHHRQGAARQSAAPGVRDAGRHAERHRAAEPRRRRRWCATSCRSSTSARRASSPTSAARPSRSTSRSRGASMHSPIDAIEINISCPNVKEGGVAFGNYPDMSAQVVAACRRVTRKPLITKLSPNQTDIRENARRCIEAGTDALAVINTIMGMAIDVAARRPVIGNVQGGLSGPAIKPIALLEGAPGLRGRSAPSHPDHRPGRHHQRQRRARVPASPAPPRSESARRSSTSRWCARASTRASAPTCARRVSRSVSELVGVPAHRADVTDCAVSG